MSQFNWLQHKEGYGHRATIARKDAPAGGGASQALVSVSIWNISNGSFVSILPALSSNAG